MLPLLFPSLLLASVPNLEEAVPGASGNSHAICCHPQAAHSVVMARKDSYGGEEERSGKEMGCGIDERVDYTENMHCKLCTYTPVYSYTTCYDRYVANKNKHAEELLCMAYNHHPPIGLAKEQYSWEGLTSRILIQLLSAWSNGRTKKGCGILDKFEK